MQSTARCARCGGGEFAYRVPLTAHPRPGGVHWVERTPFTFGRGVDPYIEMAQYAQAPILSDKPRLCCTACGFWEKTWSSSGEGPPELTGADQAMGSAGHVTGDVVQAENQ